MTTVLDPCGIPQDCLKSFYTTEIRLGTDESAPIAKIRWYHTLFDSEFLPDGTAFFSNVWNTEVGTDFPRDGIGEIGLERKWDKGVAPPGISGKSTYTPSEWFINGPPPDALVNLPIGTCGKLKAPQLLRPGIGFESTIKQTIERQYFDIGIGFDFYESIPGVSYVDMPIGLGFQFEALVDGGIPLSLPIGLGFQFSLEELVSISMPLGIHFDFAPEIPGTQLVSMPLGIHFDFIHEFGIAGVNLGLGIGFEFDALVDGEALVSMPLGIHFDFEGILESEEESWPMGLGFFFGEEGGEVETMGMGVDFFFTFLLVDPIDP